MNFKDNRSSLSKQEFYEIDDGREKGGYYKYKRDFFLKFIPNNGVKILDIGCHDGFFSEIFKRNGNEVYGVDISKKALIQAKKRGIKTECVDIEKHELPFRDNFFNIVVLGDIIEHVFDTDFILEESVRVLIPDGFLLISTPNVASLGRRLMLLFGISPYLEYSIKQTTNGLPSVGHIRYYTFSVLESQLRFYNLQIIHKEGDLINIGPFVSRKLAYIFPTLARQILMAAKKE